MNIDLYSSFFMQIMLFVLLAATLILSVVSLFLKPAKRTIRASLVDTSNGHIIDISKSETSIGRAKACDVVISDISVSRFHAVLSKRSKNWMIFDTNSTSGIKVNNKKIEKKQLLHDGDAILLGINEYVFYSTAVTTRQQIIKNKSPKSDERVKYRRPPADDDSEIIYEKKQQRKAPSKQSSQTKKNNRSG